MIAGRRLSALQRPVVPPSRVPPSYRVMGASACLFSRLGDRRTGKEALHTGAGQTTPYRPVFCCSVSRVPVCPVRRTAGTRPQLRPVPSCPWHIAACSLVSDASLRRAARPDAGTPAATTRRSYGHGRRSQRRSHPMSALPDLNGKVAVVTGGAAGVGEGSARPPKAGGAQGVIGRIQEGAPHQTYAELGP